MRTPVKRRRSAKAVADTTTYSRDWPLYPGDDPLPLKWGELKSIYRNDPHKKTLRQIIEKIEK